MPRRTALPLLACAASLLAPSLIAQQSRPPSVRVPLAEPAVSPDGATIVFASGGDLWTVPASGGDAHLLVSDPATESRPHWSPDGTHIAFVSNRTGTGDIYVLTLDSGEVRRMTWDDAPEQLDGWSADGNWLYFTTNSRDIANFSDVLRVRATGGTPMPFTSERYTTEFFAAPSPDGKLVAFSARGLGAAQWWRNGHSHLDESEIWTRDAAGKYQQVVGRKGKALWPMWAADGRSLLFMSDRGGAENIWSAAVNGRVAEPRQITKFTKGRVLWPTISRDGRTVAFERDLAIWTLNTASGEVKEVPIRRIGAPAAPSVESLRLTGQFRELAVAPDGRKLAFVVRGEVFAASSQQGGNAQRLTRTAANESDLVWSPDSNKVAYVSQRSGVPQLFLYDFVTEKEERLTNGTVADHAPAFSPDGKMLAFIRDSKELRVIDLPAKTERVLARASFALSPDVPEAPVFSPDNKWVAFLSAGGRFFMNASVVPAAGGEPQQVSFLANVYSGALAWSPDGGFLTFVTAQRTEQGQIARVDLRLKTPRFREDQFRDLFRREPATPSIVPGPGTPAPPASTPGQPPAAQPPTAQGVPPAQGTPPAPVTGAPAKPSVSVEIVTADIRRRLTYVPAGLDADDQAISPDGKWLLFTATAAGQRNLYVYSLDELADEPAVARQLTSTADSKSSAQFSPDSRDIYFLEGGSIRVVPVQRGDGRRVNVAAEMDVDFGQERLAVFQQAWALLNDNFFDPKFNGVDWNAARTRFEPYIAGSRTADEMRRVALQMIGELNASHLGLNAPPADARVTTGRLGLRFDAGEYEATGRFRITEVLALGPAGVTRQVRPGQYLVRVDGTTLNAATNLDQLLDRRIDRRVVLAVADGPDGTNAKDVPVLPTRLTTEKGLLYRGWVEDNREYVRKASNGRLGYVHMLDMSAQSLNQLMLDLDAENVARDGVVVDVRNNNGGFVNVYAIDVLARRSYFRLGPRGASSAPSRTLLGQRSLELPTVLVTNQHSLSDAEDFTEGYRSLKLGSVVGEPTAGWIIYTSNTPLIDGSIVRLPSWRVTAGDGSQMEMNPRQVDIAVTRALGEGAAGKDTQLDAAVKTLLEQIGRRTTSN